MFLLITGVVVGIYIILYHVFFKGNRCKSSAKLHGKTVIITGSNTGIGKATAVDLARRGARSYWPAEISREQRLPLVILRGGNNEVVYMHLDLASLKSVRSFAENFLKTEPRLDLLINNAGHFLLTLLLLERLKECSPSRVINVASIAQKLGTIDFNCLRIHKELGVGDSTFQTFMVYSHSKLCNLLFTHELAKRLQGTSVTCYSVHPGGVSTELIRDASILFTIIMKPISWLFFLSPDSGAQTTLHCALQEGIEPLSGSFFSSCTVQDVPPKAKDDAVARKLWEVSERLSGLP